MAKEREYEFICESCLSDFIIITEVKDEPSICPFCGESSLEDPEVFKENDEADEE